MKAFIKRINMPERIPANRTNNNNSNENFNSTKLSIFERLNLILINENKKPYYIKIAFRFFSYICIYLEKIHSDSIYVVYRNNYKYYFSSKLLFKHRLSLFD